MVRKIIVQVANSLILIGFALEVTLSAPPQPDQLSIFLFR